MVEVEEVLEVEELVMIMIRKKGERKSIRNMIKSDPKKGGSKRKRKRKNEIKRIKTHNTFLIFLYITIQEYILWYNIHTHIHDNIFIIIINYYG